MSTLTRTASTRPLRGRVLLRGVSWKSYESLLRDYDHGGVFLTYYRGVLEIMSPKYRHDKGSRLLMVMVHELGVGLNCEFTSAGSTTLRRRDLKVGLEPDEAFYFRNESKIRGKTDIDLTVDPPPDLAIEVELSRRLGARRNIYAILGIGELWRWSEDGLVVSLLDKERKYVVTERSPTFPQVDLADIERFVRLGFKENQTTWTRKIRKWIETLAA